MSRPRRALLRSASALWSAAFVAAFVAAAASAQQGWVAERQGPAGRDLNTVYFADSKRGWVGGDGGLVLRTEDGGRTFERQQTGITDNVSDIYFRDKEDGYLLAGNSVFTTTDGGESWRAAGSFSGAGFGGASPDLYSVRFTGKRRGWIVGSVSTGDRVVDSLLLYTDDGGSSWQRRAVPVKDELIHLDFDGEKRGWIVGDRGTILRTEDGGETWTRQRAETSATLYHVNFIDKERGWAVGERATILRTTDGGATWAAVRVPALGGRETLLSVSFVDEDEGWIVGRAGLILRSGDGGRTWVRQESGTKQNIYALFFRGKRGWAVGGDGMVFQYER